MSFQLSCWLRSSTSSWKFIHGSISVLFTSPRTIEATACRASHSPQRSSPKIEKMQSCFFLAIILPCVIDAALHGRGDGGDRELLHGVDGRGVGDGGLGGWTVFDHECWASVATLFTYTHPVSRASKSHADETRIKSLGMPSTKCVPWSTPPRTSTPAGRPPRSAVLPAGPKGMISPRSSTVMNAVSAADSFPPE